ncbi:MAG: hypothetical protein LBP22_13090 [Deltaproteobacteria bacterium]|jgi:hypothetical protein|nr:hypothetical protein [Deltaproteobacteria bacterium]
MTTLKEFQEINQLTGLLASGLAETPQEDMPKDVAEALLAAKKQMEDLPQVLEDLNLAFSRYMTLNHTIRRMGLLARESAAMDQGPEEDQFRLEMEEEFVALAKIVAAEAGQRYFQGTGLSILNSQSAQAAVRVLSYLEPVLKNFDHEIRGQKSLILEAISETINFMGIVARSYPQAKGVEAIKQTLGRVKLPENTDEPVLMRPTFH